MATLREIRQKIHSVGNIKKITEAMELVAAARLKKAQAKAESSRPYAEKLKEILDHLILSSDDLKNPLVTPRVVKKIGVVIIAGDRGLCGGYNQNVFSAAEKFLQNYSTEKVELITVGKKSVDYFKSKRWKINNKLENWGGKITYSQIDDFTKQLLQIYLDGQVDEIWLIYTHFISVASREVRIEKFLKIDITKIEGKSEVQRVEYLFEPNEKALFETLLPMYSISKIQGALNNAYAAELAARVTSMRSATKNAEEMIEKLILVRNKVRQAGITRELIEITSGAESLR